MTEKKEEKYFIGRYGEVIKNAEIVCFCDKNGHPVLESEADHFIVTGLGKDEMDQKANVRFVVSKKNGKKDGEYIITRKAVAGEYNQPVYDGDMYEESAYFKNDLLDGHEMHCYLGPSSLLSTRCVFEADWLRGKWVDPQIRESKANDSKSLRQLFSDASVKATIAKLIKSDPQSKKTSNAIQQIKNAMTKAITGTPSKRKKERE